MTKQVYELIAYSTEKPAGEDVRYRRYTTSKLEADDFKKTPPILLKETNAAIVFELRPGVPKREQLEAVTPASIVEHIVATRAQKAKRARPPRPRRQHQPEMRL
jgi:hypothetical protein